MSWTLTVPSSVAKEVGTALQAQIKDALAKTPDLRGPEEKLMTDAAAVAETLCDVVGCNNVMVILEGHVGAAVNVRILGLPDPIPTPPVPAPPAVPIA